MDAEVMYAALLADVKAGRLRVREGLARDEFHLVWSGGNRQAALELSCRLKRLRRDGDGAPSFGMADTWFDSVMLAALAAKTQSVERGERRNGR